MLSTRILNRYLVRTFTRSVARRNLDKSKTPETISNTTTTTPPTTASQPQQTSFGAQDMVQDFVPTEWDKRVLMLSGRYKTPEDIPRRVTYSTMNAIKSELRIKIATMLMIMVLIGCFVITRVGKSKAMQGDTLLKRQRERERQIREEGRQAILRDKVD